MKPGWLSGVRNLHLMAVAVTAAAVLLRWSLDPWLGDAVPLVTIYGAVAATVYYGGYRLALVPVVLSYIACNYLFIPPRGHLLLLNTGQYLGLTLYLLTCGIIVAFGEALRIAQRRTQEGRELLRVTFASIGDAVITTDSEHRITYLNAVAESLTGWAQKDAQGQPLTTVFHVVNEETRQPVENPVARALREGIIVGLANHSVLIAKDGTERPIDDSAAPIRDAGLRQIGCVLIFRDITERRRVEQRLGESEQRFRLMADAAPMLIWLSGPDKLCTWFNKRWLDFVGRTMEQEIGNGWAENVHPDDFDRCLRTYTAAFDARQPFSMEYRLRRHDGEYRWILDDGIPLHGQGGEFTGYIGSCVDLTDRKRTEDELRQAESQTRSVVNTVVDGIISITQDGTVESFNIAAERLFGYKAEEVIGQNVKLLMPDPYRQEHDDYIANYRRTGVAKIIGIGREVAGRRRDSSTFPMELAVSEFSLGARRYFTGIVRDITERKRAEQALKEADRRKDEFLATLAHELRNPLAPIRNAVQILKAKGPPEPDLIWGREVIDRQVQHMARLLDDLLDVSRISHSKMELRKERVELVAVIRSAVETSRPLIDGNRHELIVALPPEPVQLDADPVRLAQVFSNLLNNAAKYTPSGGHIRLSAELRGADVVASVKDDGIGIAAEMLPRVFHMFSQASRVLERSQGGLGIGLALVRGLVELHGGSIEARSEGPGKGSEFVVRLPVAMGEPMRRAAVAGEQVEMAGTAKRRLLIVDDLKDSVDSWAMLLRLMGNEVHTAYDGEAALVAAEKFRPEVALLDIGMPKLNGYEVCRRIREQPWGKAMVLVALTGWGQEDDRRRTEDAGFDHHMIKPVDPAALAQLLASLPSDGPS